jgi:hypothetical protein
LSAYDDDDEDDDVSSARRRRATNTGVADATKASMLDASSGNPVVVSVDVDVALVFTPGGVTGGSPDDGMDKPPSVRASSRGRSFL